MPTGYVSVGTAPSWMQRHQGDLRPIGISFTLKEADHGCVNVVPRHVLRARQAAPHDLTNEEDRIRGVAGGVCESIEDGRARYDLKYWRSPCTDAEGW